MENITTTTEREELFQIKSQICSAIGTIEGIVKYSNVTLDPGTISDFVELHNLLCRAVSREDWIEQFKVQLKRLE